MDEKSNVNFSSKRGVLAGIFIAIGATAYLSVDTKALGASLFALGLLTVILQKYSLFTGKIGYVSQEKDILPLALMLIKNIFGAAAVGMFSSTLVSANAAALVKSKLSKTLPDVFVAAVFCGILIYAAVELFSKNKHPLLVIMPIMIFILCGFEHCIADAFYFAASGIFNLRVLAFMLVCIAGNAVGSIAVRLAERFGV